MASLLGGIGEANAYFLGGLILLGVSSISLPFVLFLAVGVC